jgi:hypothetical protein
MKECLNKLETAESKDAVVIDLKEALRKRITEEEYRDLVPLRRPC